jgi:Flp pilus assembly protein TadD
MKRVASKIAVNTALLVTLVTATSAYAQTSEPDYAQEAYQRRAPAYADDSCQTGEYGPPVRVQPGDVIEDGEIVGRDPDPNIRTQLERENFPVSSDCY